MLAAAARAKRVTPGTLLKEAGIPNTTAYRIASGEVPLSRVTVSQLEAICNLLAVSADDVVLAGDDKSGDVKAIVEAAAALNPAQVRALRVIAVSAAV